MKISRLHQLFFSTLFLIGSILSLSFGVFRAPARAAFGQWVFTPSPQSCYFLSQGQTEFSFDLQADGAWQGIQRTKQTSSLSAPEKIFSGTSMADLRAFLLESPCGLSTLAGEMTLELKGRVQAGQTFQLVLPSNPSTGYLWEVEGGVANTTITREQIQMRQMIPRIGGMAAQSISLRALRSTIATISLRYHRPWETESSPGIVYRVQAEQVWLSDLAQSLSLHVPSTAMDSANPVDGFPKVSTPIPEQIAAAQELPTAFNWCSLGKCTPVRNQGNCGSCWAFSTVGVLESKLLIADNNSQDLSEQYLVSCNTNNWGCDGGWFAHDYHIWKIPPSESQAGAVLESSFRYQAADLPCNGPYSHPYRALSWHYSSTYDSIPSPAAIKQAIYTYGPVAAAVCAGSAFEYYRGGVFATDEKTVCGSSLVNHGIVLVGWDDSQGVWILRNSWGPYWGEGGYMRIKYGVSNVGLGANYLVYNSSPSPTAPAATTPPPNTPAPTTPPPTTVVPPYPPPTTEPGPYPGPQPSGLINYLPLILNWFLP